MADDNTTDQETAEVEPKQFAQFLIEHAKGKSHDELSYRLRDLLEAIESTGKGGSITYRLTIKPEPRADHAVVITDEIKSSVPNLDRPASIFFIDDSFRLQRNDPRQLSLDSFADGE